MSARRHRPIVLAVAGVMAVWLLAWAGYRLSSNAKVTADRVAAYLKAVDLGKLAGEDRAQALRDLARQMNALSVEERRKARLDGEWDRWFKQMTEAEKEAFLEATLPSGFKQMLSSFEQMPEEKRRQVVARAIRDMEKARETADPQDPAQAQRTAGERPGELSPELQQKVVKIGLKSFYSESSAQTKVELTPLIEEMQRLMESGKALRNMPR